MAIRNRSLRIPLDFSEQTISGCCRMRNIKKTVDARPGNCRYKELVRYAGDAWLRLLLSRWS